MEIAVALNAFAPYRTNRSRYTLRLMSSPPHTLKVWLSTLPWEIQEGLNDVPPAALEAHDTGMLFKHATPEPLHYWISRVQVDLDVAFYSASREMVSVGAITRDPRVDAMCPNAQYVLEVAKGAWKALGGPGCRFTLDTRGEEELLLRDRIENDVIAPLVQRLKQEKLSKTQRMSLLHELGIYIPLTA